MGSESKRPLGVTIIAIWFVLEGIYYFYINSIGMFGGQNISDLFSGSLQENSSVAYGLSFAIFSFVIAWAFWEGKPWIRIPTIIVLSITVCVSWVLAYLRLAGAFETILSTILLAIVVIYMMKYNVKKYFIHTDSGAPIK